MQSAQILSGPVQLAGCPSHETMGQAHQVFQASSHAEVSSSLLLLPQPACASATKHATNSSGRYADLLILRVYRTRAPNGDLSQTRGFHGIFLERGVCAVDFE